jgi:anti-sigma B factor antagonist
MMPLQIKTTQKALSAYLISCSGRLDTETAPLLEKEVRQILQKAPQVLALDMEHVNYMSSAGIRVLLIAHKGMKELGGKVALLKLQPQIKKVLEIINALPGQKIFRDMNELDSYLDTMQKKVLEEG